jgi:hypothetical protein
LDVQLLDVQLLNVQLLNVQLLNVQLLHSVDPQLESARFQPLYLKFDLPVSKFAFKCNLYCYAAALVKLANWCAAGDEKTHNLTVAALDPEFHYHVLNTVARGGRGALTPGGCQIGHMCDQNSTYGLSLTPGGCQIGYTDPILAVINWCLAVINWCLAVINWCFLPYALLGLSLPGVVRLVTWTTPAVIN